MDVDNINGFTVVKDGIKILGIYYGNEEFQKKNWETCLTTINDKMNYYLYKKNVKSLRTKASILNTYILPVAWFVMQVLNPTPNVLMQIEKLILKFIWSGHHWVKKEILFLPLYKGGLDIINIGTEYLRRERA